MYIVRAYSRVVHFYSVMITNESVLESVVYMFCLGIYIRGLVTLSL